MTFRNPVTGEIEWAGHLWRDDGETTPCEHCGKPFGQIRYDTRPCDPRQPVAPSAAERLWQTIRDAARGN